MEPLSERIRNYPAAAVAVQATLQWLPVLVLLAIALWLLERDQRAAVSAALGARERAGVDHAAGLIAAEIRLPLEDLPYLADLPALQAWLAEGSPQALDRVARDFLTFAHHRDAYAKVRLFNAEGTELVRINGSGSGAELVPRGLLQNKAGRDFVRDGLAQPPDRIHVSAFDLNVDNGVIEQPFRPMLRFSAPVRSPAGELRGLVTINYLGQPLLDELAQTAAELREFGLWLLDPAGHWLLGERPGDAGAEHLGGRLSGQRAVHGQH